MNSRQVGGFTVLDPSKAKDRDLELEDGEGVVEFTIERDRRGANRGAHDAVGSATVPAHSTTTKRVA